MSLSRLSYQLWLVLEYTWKNDDFSAGCTLGRCSEAWRNPDAMLDDEHHARMMEWVRAVVRECQK